MTTFKLGEIVRKKNGWSPMEVTWVSTFGGQVRVKYCSRRISTYQEHFDQEGETGLAKNFVLVREPDEEFSRCRGDWKDRMADRHMEQLEKQKQTGVTNMNKLYQTKEETPRFGTYLAINSAGLIVLEMKGTGAVEAFDKKEVEEVKPYTVRVRFTGSNQQGYEFFASKGDVEKGDLLYLKGYNDLAQVIAVDTKSSKATKNLVGRKLLTESFGEEDE